MIGRAPKQLLDEILSLVGENNASDIHISTGRPPILRIDGVLHVIQDIPPLGEQDVYNLAALVLNEDRAKAFIESKKEVDASYVRDENFRFRVNSYMVMGRPTLAIRSIPKHIRTLEELHLPQSLEEFTKPLQGFVLVTGPTGHGKTTTMASLVNMINRNRIGHIITIEDPIEYIYEEDQCLIHQREVGQDTESFGQALRVSFREDPNIVVIGEMRDLESISAALTIAETGHLVFTTLHTNDAAQTVDRIVDVFPANQQDQIRTQLAGILTGIISQRLLPKQGGGRIPALEVMFATSAIRNLIQKRETRQIRGVIETSRKEGMISLEQSLVELIRSKEVLEEDAIPYLRDPQSLVGRV